MNSRRSSHRSEAQGVPVFCKVNSLNEVRHSEIFFFFLDRPSHSSADSRPNTAPAGTRITGSGAGARSSGVTSRPRESPASSSSAAVVPSSRATSSGPKGGPIQMSALSNVLSSLGTSATPGTTDEGNAQPSNSSTDLNDMKTREVRSSEVPLLVLQVALV